MTELEAVRQIAEKFKQQYFKYKKWVVYQGWPIQPEKIYLIARELKTFKAFDALVGNDSWTRWSRRKLNEAKRKASS